MKKVHSWLYFCCFITVIIWFILLCLFLVQPGYAASLDFWQVEVGDISSASTIGDASGSCGPERDPQAPPLETITGEAGVPSGYGSEIEDESEEDEPDVHSTGEAGVPSGYGSEIEDESEEDEPDAHSTGEAGVPSGISLEYEDVSEEDEPDGYNTGEAGVPETEGEAFYYAPGEVAPLVISPGEAAGVPEENDGSTDSEEEIEDGENVNQSEAGEESGNAGEIGGIVDTVNNIRLTMLFLLGSLWALGGVLLAFEIGRSAA